ncbi:MAG: SGNH/GDSL hydrolase family protein [Prosthecobacter sp.]
MMQRLCVLLVFLMSVSLVRAERCLVLGDSLTKEYETEFKGLYPQNPAAWQARNWVEILHQHRTDWFDMGPWGTYRDPRVTGHRYNWALPGATTTEIRNLINAWYSSWWTDTLKDHIRNEVDRVIIFAGGNDADSYYAQLYSGNVGPEVTNTTLSNLQWLVQYVRSVRMYVPIVVVSVPHVGCSPKVQQGYPTDPVKTGRVTAAMDQLNANLAAFAQSEGIGFVPGVYEFTKHIITEPFRIRGIEFYRVADPDCRTRYAFSGDGFHPNTCAHTKIAQMIADEFNRVYPAPIDPLDDHYIITTVLGLDPDIPYHEWMAANGQSGAFDQDSDHDGVSNGMEFALNQSAMPLPVVQNGALTLTCLPNPVFLEWGTLKAQSSPNLMNWTDIPASQTVTNADGSVTVSAAFTGRGFMRLQALPQPGQTQQ